ncbi:MAG: hypothetical protein H0U75_10260 [Legionella sp.]|nr:hypothetical protein [Legionella sp.]
MDMVTSINYLEDKDILAKIILAPLYRKKELTDLRLIQDKEQNKQHRTYILNKSTNVIQLETTNTMSTQLVLARNQKPIGTDSENKPIYNEWLIPKDVVKKNYGEEVYRQLSHQFKGFSKKVLIHALYISTELVEHFRKCQAVDEEGGIHLRVPWGSGEMLARKGDYLTNVGYAIAANHMTDYELTVVPIKEYLADNKLFFKTSTKDEPDEEIIKYDVDVKDGV